MTGIKDLTKLLASMEPKLHNEEFVYCSFPDTPLIDLLNLNPIGFFQEEEGLTLIITKNCADKNGTPYDSVLKLISLTIHSSLEAVGLTAAISQKLSSRGISANVVAAYYHDHIFVPVNKAEEAISALRELQKESL